MAVSAALVLAPSPPSVSIVGGVPVVVRAARALRAAGVAEVRVLDPASPDAGLLAETGAEPVLVVSGDVLFEPEVLAPLLAAAEPGRLRLGWHPADGAGGVRAALCPRGVLPRLVGALRAGTGALAPALASLDIAAPTTVALGKGLFLVLDPGAAPGVLVDALLERQSEETAATDGYLTRFLDRPVSRAITRRLLAGPVRPNQVTVASILIGLTGAAGLATAGYAARLASVLALWLSSVLDGVDGELARARLEQSRLGARLDLAGDYAVHLATFLGLAVGLVHQGLPPGGRWAAGALVAGVAAAMALVHAMVLRPGTRAGDRDGSPVPVLVERIANRDYVYLLVVAALLDHLEWFVYSAAVGAWVFVGCLLAYSAYERWATPRLAARPGSD